MSKILARNYKGTCDWLGNEAYLRQWVMGVLREVFESFGFEPLETPEIELKEVLAGKYGTEGDQLSYYFSKGKDSIGLRYDHTVPLARVVTQYEENLIFPYRRYAMGPVFRADEPQKGRYRRFIQCDFDVIGVSDPIADAEVVALTYTALKRLGFENFEIQICDRRLLSGMAKACGADTEEMVMAFMRGWDKLDRIEREQIGEELKEKGASVELIARFSETTDKLLSLEKEDIIDKLRQLFPNQPLVTQGTETLEKLMLYLEKLNVPPQFYRVNPCLARGLAYYTGPIFETVIKDSGIGSITGGGRFDDLIKTLGGPDLPATGSSFGLERIVSVMKTLGIAKQQETATNVFVGVFDQSSPDLVAKAIQMAAQLRANKIPTELSMIGGSIGKQLRVADRRKIPIAVFAGPEELKSKTIVVKDLSVPLTKNGKDKWINQWRVPEEELVKKVKELISTP